MKIAVLSDTHDNLRTLDLALPYLREVDVVLHCGDVCAPFTLKRLAEGIAGKPLHLVWGNNDGDRRMLAKIAEQVGNVHIHGEFADFAIGDFKIAMSHYPEVARAVARAAEHDLVCYGHDHTLHSSRISRTLLLNPGELHGGLTGKSTFAILDTESTALQVIELKAEK